MKQDLNKQQRLLVENYIKPAGVTDKRILEAFLKIPRHKFIRVSYRDQAYLDIPLPIGEGQTITQPSLVAIMTQALQLKGGEKVLEIGTGSGFQAAILSTLAKEVYTIERIEKLAKHAKRVLKNLGLHNVHVVTGNGTIGLAEHAPFDAIIVTAGARVIPKPLVAQLKESGHIVIPVGEEHGDQKLKVGTKRRGKLEVEDIERVRFVPLIGKYGWGKTLLGLCVVAINYARILHGHNNLTI